MQPPVDLSRFTAEELAAIQAAAAAAIASVQSSAGQQKPCFAAFYANPANDATFLPTAPASSPFLHIATKLKTSLNNDAALRNICNEPVPLRPAFLICERTDANNLRLVVCSGLHYHAESYLTPSAWDEAFFAFRDDSIMGQMPATVEFEEDWLNAVETPSCSIQAFEDAIKSNPTTALCLTVEKTERLLLPKACAVPISLVTPIIGQHISPLRAWPKLRARAFEMGMGEAANNIWQWLIATGLNGSKLNIDKLPTVAPDATLYRKRIPIFEQMLPPITSASPPVAPPTPSFTAPSRGTTARNVVQSFLEQAPSKQSSGKRRIFFFFLALLIIQKIISIYYMRRALPIVDDAFGDEKESSFVLTFVGDTMISTQPSDYAMKMYNNTWRLDEGFDNLVPLRGDYIVANLEGAITDAPLSEDPNNKSAAFSFGMTPGVEKSLAEKVKINAANLGNNHASDRNVRGLEDTKKYLDSVGIAYFGAGLSWADKYKPHIFDTPYGRVGISSFEEDTCCPTIKLANGTKVVSVAKVKDGNVSIGVELQRKANVDIKIAFVHWGSNYMRVKKHVRESWAPKFAAAGYDLVIGSGGTHTVQPLEYINGVPVLFDIGNFVFEKPTRFHRIYDGKPSLPYGSVLHVILDANGISRLEVRCTFVDNNQVKYRPRYCTKEQAKELFSILGPHATYRDGDEYAVINFRSSSGNLTTNTANT